MPLKNNIIPTRDHMAPAKKSCFLLDPLGFIMSDTLVIDFF
ncbi:hypothetical protein DBT_2293 [Dissulfuribacter thermophilus]|uniref:Uncharacterized protein n=1 Tax=Dissulfuribacter thermophilus TaxID=1156395 RepID=A0A1B9F397_9BACT|nr:hypothetical protein DBT_2293 [Dissulfuribacter thermophilus]